MPFDSTDVKRAEVLQTRKLAKMCDFGARWLVLVEVECQANRRQAIILKAFSMGQALTARGYPAWCSSEKASTHLRRMPLDRKICPKQPAVEKEGTEYMFSLWFQGIFCFRFVRASAQ